MTSRLSPRPAPRIRQSDLLNRLPTATYRLQLRTDFGLEQCAEITGYLTRLGISDLYLSPLFQARSDSEHGYDVVDHTRIEPAFGGQAALNRLGKATRASGLGILLDIVPNHMGINDPDNIYWNDVLENGPESKYSGYFDIDWNPPGSDFPGRVLLPFLGKRFGDALEDGELVVTRSEDGFVLNYFDRKFPLTPLSWPEIIETTISNCCENVGLQPREELQSIAFQLEQLKSQRISARDRYREQCVARKRLKKLLRDNPSVVQAIDTTLQRQYCDVESPEAMDSLEHLLSQQFYRLAYWPVAVDEINYRRFFDINDLAAIRVEEPEVFDAVHRLTFDLLGAGTVTGLRIDHPDGLLDPAAYFEQLQAKYRQLVARNDKTRDEKSKERELYVVVEKILSGDEPLPANWAVSGTTGYELLNQISSILVDIEGVKKLQVIYRDATGISETPRDIAYTGKQAILQDAMASELFVLASRLFRMARANRYSCDFTLPVLQRALREYIACFAVYRTYIRPYGWDVEADDHGRVREAIRVAKIRNPTMSWAALDFLQDILLLQFPQNLHEDIQHQWRQFAVRLQQLTGPVTAKGLEDTSFYRYYPLASLNEVGAELGSSGVSVDTFHAQMERRALDWPCALSATATHDTKRGEDVRARLHVLSELPERFSKAFKQWCQITGPLAPDYESQNAPDINEKYLIFQTLLGTWPARESNGTPHPATEESFRTRIQAYFEKAFREAKQHTSWRTPSVAFESAVKQFLMRVLDTDTSPAFQILDELSSEISAAGYINSLTQLVLKATLPGVPDFYQGTEYWSFCLVDPDNRQPVDFSTRKKSLEKLQIDFDSNPAQALNALAANWGNELKQFFVVQLLRMRRECKDIFSSGDYQPLHVSGTFADHVIAFCRRFDNQVAIIVVPRLPYQLAASTNTQPSSHNDSLHLRDFIGDVWKDTAIELDSTMPQEFTETLTGRNYEAHQHHLRLSQLFVDFPFAVLTSALS